MRVVPARPSRGLKSDFSDVLGRGAGSARSTSESIVRMAGVYTAMREIASETHIHVQKAAKPSNRINPAG
jgi:hypothetical protein